MKKLRDEESQGEQTFLFDEGRGYAQGPLKIHQVVFQC